MRLTERHPMLERAGIDDVLMHYDWLNGLGMIAAPTLTFQYRPEGQLDTSAMPDETPLCEDAPAVFRDRFIRRWGEAGRDGEACWARVRELKASALRDLPDNPFVLRAAWLLGLVEEMPAWERAGIALLHERIAEHLAERADEAKVVLGAREAGTRQELRRFVTDVCCNGDRDQCSADLAVEYVEPQGEEREP
jgi:hypothetical protein